jgi:exopolysaccharide production protein ExoQ
MSRNLTLKNDSPKEISVIIDGDRAEGWLAVVIGILLGCCILGLMHNIETIGQDEVDSVEAGGGIEAQEDFEADVNSASMQKKLGFVGLGLVGLYCFLTAPGGWYFGSLSVLGAASAFLSWLAASTFWSTDPTQTQRELIRIGVYLFLAVSLVRRFQSRDVVKTIIACMLISVGAVYLGEIAVGSFRPWDSDFRMHGSIHSSSLAHHSLVIALCAAALAIDSPKKFLLWLLVAFALFTIIFSKTRGGLAATIVGLFVIQSLQRSLKTNLFFIAALVFVGSAAVLLTEIGGSEVRSRFGSTLALGRSEEVSTLTGRLPLWRVVWEDSKETRIFGAGYGAFWSTNRTFSLAGTLDWFPRHSHNAYLETIVDLGCVGLTLLLGIVVVSLIVSYRMFKKTRNVAYAFVVAFVAAGIIDGFVEVIFVSIRELGLFIGLAICTLMLPHRSDAIAYSKTLAKPRSVDRAIACLHAPHARRRVSGQSS